MQESDDSQVGVWSRVALMLAATSCDRQATTHSMKLDVDSLGIVSADGLHGGMLRCRDRRSFRLNGWRPAEQTVR